MSILDLLGEVPSGQVFPLDWHELGEFLSERYIGSSSEEARRSNATRRQAFYDDRGESYLEDLIAKVFTDREVIAKRKQWVAHAKYNNVIKRVVNELSTIYATPAMRTVDGELDNARYQVLQDELGQHSYMKRVERWLNLHHHILVGFRVRSNDRMPVMDIVTPDRFYAVSHPLDRTRRVMFGIDQTFDGPRRNPDSPATMWWTDTETFKTTAKGTVIQESVREHGLEEMPWTLVSIDPPASCLLEGSTGEDLVAAHMDVWFENVLLLKESKSATRQPVFAGDTTQMARQQAADSEVPLEAPDGVSTTVVDYSMDLKIFRDTADHILERAAANYGIPPAVLQHQGATSGYEMELRRVGIREQRRDREIALRKFEKWLVRIQAMVLRQDRPELAFDPSGFSLNFGEVSIPRNEAERDALFENRRRLGLTDTVDELMRRDPDLGVEQAFSKLRNHVDVEVLRNTIMRPLQQISGSMGAEQDSGDDDQ
jgi:hypothetical protein